MLAYAKVLGGLLASLVGTLGLAAIGFPFPPDFLMIPVAWSARGGHPVRAMFTGLIAGLLEDTLRTPPRLFGLHAFSKILIGFLLASLEGHVIIEKPWTLGALLTGAVVLESGSLSLLLWLLRGDLLVPDTSIVFLRALMTGWAVALAVVISRIPWRQRFLRRNPRLLKDV